MKLKEYKAPQIEMTEFDTEDIIRTSGAFTKTAETETSNKVDMSSGDVADKFFK